ncbi:unnamed protein product [Rotaria magnacalcarata]|uniref:Uncharacterized protein n=1 Tax=Rotaria magnacalcarata TaxID=392030 RepID=A0A815FZM5_9BILA|nr:unnamed protein product [Rotaria magnacalcarata]CAF1332012.1 unnamed protein product [Rotaria magnacalcarata]
MEYKHVLTSLFLFCAVTFVLFAIVAILILSLIPLYLKSNPVAYNANSAFNVSYSIASGNLPTGSLSASQQQNIATQLSKMGISTVDISISSAVVTNVANSGRRRAATSTSQILQLIGIARAQSGCSLNCFKQFVKQLKSNLCSQKLQIT